VGVLRASVLHVKLEEAVQDMIITAQEEIWTMVAMKDT